MIQYKKRFLVPIYNKRVEVIFTDDFDEALRANGINLDPGNNGYDGLALYKDGGNRYTILLEPTTTHSILAHEALHITNYILRDIGVVADYDNDEPSTYLLDYIIEQIYKYASKIEDISIKIILK